MRSSPSSPSLPSYTPVKSANDDRRHYRIITLPNGLEALLCYDEDMMQQDEQEACEGAGQEGGDGEAVIERHVRWFSLPPLVNTWARPWCVRPVRIWVGTSQDDAKYQT